MFRGTHPKPHSFSKLEKLHFFQSPFSTWPPLAPGEGKTSPGKDKNDHPSVLVHWIPGRVQSSKGLHGTCCSHLPELCPPHRPAAAITFGALLVSLEQLMDINSDWSQHRELRDRNQESMAMGVEPGYGSGKGSAPPSYRDHHASSEGEQTSSKPCSKGNPMQPVVYASHGDTPAPHH